MQPLPLLLLAVGMHAAGRVAAFCNPYRVDSLIYAVSAYRFWQPGGVSGALIPDKPPGQAILTGWVYRVFPDTPSRLTLVLIESLFMLSAYAVFWLMALRFFGRRVAAALTLLVVITFNACNALDTTTDGFNLNENYLALPMWLAAWAHLSVRDPLHRGLLRGLGLGVALSIKQTAIGLVGAMIVHGLIRYRRERDVRSATISALGTAAVVVLVGGSLAVFLASQGCLGTYVAAMARLSSERVGAMQWRWPADYRLLPGAPFAWWAAIGLLVALWPGQRVSRVHGAADCPGLLSFACLWFVAEAMVLWSLQIPAGHYYQQLVAPAAILAGLGWRSLQERLRGLSTSERVAANCWMAATTLSLGLLVAMPLLAAASKLVHTFDPRAEVRLFKAACEGWRASEFRVDEENRP